MKNKYTQAHAQAFTHAQTHVHTYVLTCSVDVEGDEISADEEDLSEGGGQTDT